MFLFALLNKAAKSAAIWRSCSDAAWDEDFKTTWLPGDSCAWNHRSPFFEKFNYLLNLGLVGSGNKKGGASFRDDSP